MTKGDFKTIEIEALTKMYKGETFFSLFSEVEPILHSVMNIGRPGTGMATLSNTEKNLLERTLGYVFDRPSPVHLIESNECKLSILKQCLLFDKEDHKARVMIFKLSHLLGLHFSKYIDCINDLALIMKEIPT